MMVILIGIVKKRVGILLWVILCFEQIGNIYFDYSLMS